MGQYSEINNELLIKYLRNDLDETEKSFVISWLEVDTQNQDFLFGLKEAYLISQWDKIKEDADTDNEWNKLQKEISIKHPKESLSIKKIVFNTSKYAAIAIIAIVFGFFLNQQYSDLMNKSVSIETGIGRNSVVVLADGSKVTLNAKSKLIYNNQSNKSRSVFLDGEAVFEIRKQHGEPFYVNTDFYKIKVLGTVFNVSTYNNDDYVSTTLKTGKVQIFENKTNKLIFEMKEGDRFKLDKVSGEYSIKRETDLNNEFGWFDGKMCFDDISLHDLTHKLEREFGYTFKIKDNQSRNYRYKASIEKESLESILNYISFVTPEVKFQINKEQKKVVIY